MDKLKAYLALTDRTPGWLAREIGVHPNSVLNWLAGRASPGGMMIRRLHITTGIPLDDIVPREPVDPPKKARRKLVA